MLEAMQKPVGELLRETRAQRGIAIEQAAETTRISRNYLQALEDEAFEKLPNTAYIKGFLRVYAGYLGLSGDEVVRGFEAASNARSCEKAGAAEERDPAPARRAARLGNRRWLSWSVPMFLAFLLGGYYLAHDEEGSWRHAQEVPAASPSRPMPVQPQQSTAHAEPSPQQPQQAMDHQGDAPQPRPGSVLRLKANEECWLAVTIDDNMSQTYQLKPGDLIEWIGEKSFSLDVGNSGGVEVEFNGKALEPLGERGKPAHLVLTPDGNVSP